MYICYLKRFTDIRHRAEFIDNVQHRSWKIALPFESRYRAIGTRRTISDRISCLCGQGGQNKRCKQRKPVAANHSRSSLVLAARKLLETVFFIPLFSSWFSPGFANGYGVTAFSRYASEVWLAKP
jgi:hypothetical protein